MSESEVTREGVQPKIPGRGGLTGAKGGRRRRGGEQPVVPDATFTSYYGKPIINSPVWEAPDIAGYFFTGGLAGASSAMALAADATGRRGLARVAKVGSAVGVGLSLAGLIHDLGRPGRFLNMLRVIKVTSPMSVGSWLLAGYAPLAAAAAGSALTGRLPRLGLAATGGAALLGTGVSTYTAALVSDTAVPAWHDGYRELPFLFAGSSAASAGGLGLLAGPSVEAGLPRRLAVAGAATEIAATRLMRKRLGMVAEPYSEGRSGRLVEAAEKLLLAGSAAALAGARRPWLGRVGGALLLTASATTRWGVFEAGMASADDPKYTVEPQRARLAAQGPAHPPAERSRPPAAGAAARRPSGPSPPRTAAGSVTGWSCGRGVALSSRADGRLLRTARTGWSRFPGGAGTPAPRAPSTATAARRPGRRRRA
ncbi:polysulfide reductase NrfD [Blastococcus sp. BMG 814]|uniref:Polysulfide reductase NrfD n=1 Tax=Blastococcus carthaginiensis TaxID=3050034 RepID=A0ABT9I8B3_9ACTN|nr:NrfD/PsrC family molybdoenzyme membrane anchor subunit [Blastococcus carthaginiensis]MDP5181821.1 polysulfide reductase NrfD [Blastococcus carthaginiensis]